MIIKCRNVAILALWASFAAGVATWATLEAPQSAARDAAQGTWMRLKPTTIKTTITLAGHLETASRTVVTAPFEATLQLLNVTNNRRIHRGQTLASLDTSLLDMQSRQSLSELLKSQREERELEDWANSPEVRRAQRALASVKQTLEKTQRDLSATRSLYDQGIVARMEVETLEQQNLAQTAEERSAQEDLRATLKKGTGDNLRIAKMELANAQARYDAIESMREKKIIEAPFDGLVLMTEPSDSTKPSATSVTLGSKVIQGQPLFEIVNLEEMQAVGKIEESDLSRIKEGMPVDVTGEGFEGSHFEGKIQSIDSQKISSSGSGAFYAVIVSLPKIPPEKKLRLGMSAQLAITTYENPHGLLAPIDSILRVEDGYQAIISDDPSHPPKTVSVTLGESTPEGVELFGVEPGKYILQPSRPTEHH